MARSGAGVKAIIETLGAVVGLAAYLFVVGGAIVWLRANHAGLPGEVVVAATPNPGLIAAGLVFIWEGLLVAAGAITMIATIWALIRWSEEGEIGGRKLKPVLVNLIISIAVATAVGILAWAVVEYKRTALAVGVAALAYIAAFTALRQRAGRHEWIGEPERPGVAVRSGRTARAVTYGAVTLLVTAGVAIAFNADEASRLHPVTVELTDGRCVAGLYVTRNSGEILIMTPPATTHPSSAEYRLLTLQSDVVSTIRLAQGRVATEGRHPVAASGCPASLAQSTRTGTSGAPAGATGRTGEPGAQGAPGKPGAKGTGAVGGKGGNGGAGGLGGTGGVGGTGGAGGAGGTGKTGERGPPGPQGKQGAAGKEGPRGATGERGPKGVAGPRGAAGPRGPAGRTSSDSLPVTR